MKKIIINNNKYVINYWKCIDNIKHFNTSFTTSHYINMIIFVVLVRRFHKPTSFFIDIYLNTSNGYYKIPVRVILAKSMFQTVFMERDVHCVNLELVSVFYALGTLQ